MKLIMQVMKIESDGKVESVHLHSVDNSIVAGAGLAITITNPEFMNQFTVKQELTIDISIEENQS